MSWFAILIFLLVTLVIKIEGWACWLMILPFFLLFSSLGGVLAGYFKLKRHKRSNKLQLSILLLLPFVASPVEQLISHIPGGYEVYTYADIHASPAVIWSNVVRVLDGAYRMEKLGEGYYRLHLYSHFTVRTTFNFYASRWAGLIMKDIQNNILKVIQTRCQAKL